MATSRAESQQSQYSRRRSNTAQSILRPIPAVPLQYGDFKILNSWVHDTKDDSKESQSVIFNQSWWPGVAEGDLLRVMGSNSNDPDFAFLFTVPKDDGCSKPQLQISIPKPIAEIFRLRNNSEVTATKVDRKSCCAEYVEFVFQDQYLGRNDMWRLGKDLVGQCIYTDQQITYHRPVSHPPPRRYIDPYLPKRRFSSRFVVNYGSSLGMANATTRKLYILSFRPCSRNGALQARIIPLPSSSYPAYSTRNMKSITLPGLSARTNMANGTRTSSRSSQTSK
ncbi:hypothetical protein FPV67DRAFT_178639 [Lyophyllum atratum]|nr:hypothetical protein FPV67DRAFT_178639 [Lyophyllum atratum]